MPAADSAKTPSFFQSLLKGYILEGILLVALGVVFLLLPKASLNVLCVVLGATLVVMGIIKLIFFAANANGNRRPAQLIVGIIQMVAGFALIIKPDFFISLFQIVVGVVLIYGSLLLFFNAYRLRDIRGPFFVMSIVFGILILVLGAIIVANPAGFANFMMQLQGIALIIEGVALIVATHTIKREAKNVSEALADRIRLAEPEDGTIPAEVVDESNEYFPQPRQDDARTEYYSYRNR